MRVVCWYGPPGDHLLLLRWREFDVDTRMDEGLDPERAFIRLDGTIINPAVLHIRFTAGVHITREHGLGDRWTGTTMITMSTVPGHRLISCAVNFTSAGVLVQSFIHHGLVPPFRGLSRAHETMVGEMNYVAGPLLAAGGAGGATLERSRVVMRLIMAAIAMEYDE